MVANAGSIGIRALAGQMKRYKCKGLEEERQKEMFEKEWYLDMEKYTKRQGERNT